MQSDAAPQTPRPATIALPSPEATSKLARQLARHLMPGDTLLLTGPVGAGKTFFARSLIQTMLAEDGRYEEVPSPTFSLVQTYDTGQGEVWHADLYRLTGEDQLDELGLGDALGREICLVEWPERLSAYLPPDALSLRLLYDDRDPEARHAELSAAAGRWRPVLEAMATRSAFADD
ncbi:MAG: tRNA (adenosine(37)-N6)-threonylcarbamoyltransferase complex ATPase subunit type 1 TsaE [Rhodobacteraceae bacterium]|nr:tRNA (adenosine(37)-N6)-threonylcarbamoyltransferase complex ATPase subunit type 1 TsaE [Paracoccaceae bacterium]